MRLARVDAARGSMSQTGPSQTVDPTQYQQDYQVYEEPQPHQYHFDAYQQHRVKGVSHGKKFSLKTLTLPQLGEQNN